MFNKMFTKQLKESADLLGAPWQCFDTYYYSPPASPLLGPVLFPDVFFASSLSEFL